MKVEKEFVLVAKDVSTDSEDKMMSIIKLIDNLEISVPTDIYKRIQDNNNNEAFLLPADFVITSSFRFSKKTDKNLPLTMNAKVISPDNKQLGEISQSVAVERGNNRFRINIKNSTIPVVGDGEYSFVISISDNNKTLAEGSVYLDVKVIESPEPVRGQNG